MFSLLMEVHGAEGAFVMNYAGRALQVRGKAFHSPLPKVVRGELENGPLTLCVEGGGVLALGQVGEDAILVGVFPAGTSEHFAAAAVQAILFVL
ncbi:hypothetical protein LZ198_42755 [Myxococcus sp. K15C18031901]|uniref:hypothetical protein n=1 Tax=Myxococcus dinghuensis TaxID=2906761 RepID=UPI0020A6FC08|nr:hypothetical protein [Myxococcus dinghuensis]MCP3105586.1 hypothetical protein [Myxococcus dinghuensis]